MQTTIFNKSYIWTTLDDHALRSDEEIISLCRVNLVFLDQTMYGIIRKIRAPNPVELEQKTPSTATTRKKSTKKTCRDSTWSKTAKKTEQKPKQAPAREKRSRTLSESRQVTFGIQAPPTVTRSVRSNRQNIDYLTLNDGLEDDEVSSPKRKKRTTYRPCSGPSATHQAARKHTASPKPKSVPKMGNMTTLPALPSSTAKRAPDTDLTGVPSVTDDQILPDLVPEQEDLDTLQATGAISTEEEMDAAAALLSLGEVRDDTLDGGDDNAELMPIGGQNVPVDAVPEPICLDQLSVDKAIEGLIQSEEQTKDDTTNDQPDDQPEQPTPAPKPDNVPKSKDSPKKQKPDRGTEDHDKPEPAMKGTLEMKTYTLKKKIETKR